MNKLLERASISTKINAPIILLALVMCASIVWLTRTNLATDAAYSDFLDTDMKSQTSLLVARVAYNRLLGQTYQLVLETDAERMRSLNNDLDDRFKRAMENLDIAEKATPEHQDAIRAVREKITTVYDGIKPAVAASMANDNSLAVQILNDKVEPYTPKIVASFEAILRTLEETVTSGSDELTTMAESTSNTALALGIAIALSMLAAAYVIGRAGITKPLSAQIAVIEALCRNDLSVKVEGTERGDELGNLARASGVFKDNLVRVQQMEAEKKEAERRAAEQRKADMNRLADEFQRAVGGIVSTVSSASSQLEGAANALTKTAETTQQLSGMVAATSEQTSANVQGVAAASEELASTVSEISRQVQQSSSIAGQAVTQAAKTNERVQELSQSAERIGNVIGLINSIAGQTNLLALNATIEAARAGDAGKGFAVVAQEVKALAAQTGKATDEIASQIASMQSATEEAVNAIREITETINKISEISGAIAAAVEEQGATTQEISRNVTEAAKGTSEVASSITDVSKGASDTGSASSQVLTSAKQLSSESSNLRREVDRFLATVRAA